MQCVNLRERFGKRYRVSFEEGYPTKGRPRAGLSPWRMELRCQFGTVYPWGDGLLCVQVDRHPIAAKKLRAMGGVELIQDGDHEKTFRFPVDRFGAVAEIVRPRRRRRLTPEQIAAATERIRRVNRQKPSTGRKTAPPRDAKPVG